MKKTFLCMVCLCLCVHAHAQIKFNYGLGFNLNWEPMWKHGYLNSFRIGLSGGCGVFIGKNFMPYLQYTQNFYQGGLGTSLSVKERYKIIVESLLAKGIVIGAGRNADYRFNKPIYTMGFFNPTPLYTDFDKVSLNLANTSVFRFNKSSGNFSQQV